MGGVMEGEAARLAGEGKTSVFVAESGRVLGLLGFADQPKPSAAAAVTSAAGWVRLSTCSTSAAG